MKEYKEGQMILEKLESFEKTIRQTVGLIEFQAEKIYALGMENKRLNDALGLIRQEIAEYKDDKVIHAERNEMVDIMLEIIDRHTKGEK